MNSRAWEMLECSAALLDLAQDGLPSEGVPEAFRIRLRVAISRAADLIDQGAYMEQLVRGRHCEHLDCIYMRHDQLFTPEPTWACNAGPAACPGLQGVGYPIERRKGLKS